MTDPAVTSSDRGIYLLKLARGVGGALERVATPLYAAVILGFLLVFLAAVRFLTVEADEAWILLSTMNAWAIPLPATSAVASPTLTSGGLHLLIHGPLALVTSSIYPHRLVSLLFTGLLLTIVFRALRRMDRPTPTALAGTALFAAAPGLLLQSALATPEIIATVFLVWACLHWVRRGQSSNIDAVVSGILFGLSCATRVNCVIALPAILIFALLAGADWRTRLFRAALTTGIAAAMLALGMAAYYLAARSNNGAEAQQFFMESAGVSGGKSPTEFIWAFAIGDRILPAWLIAAVGGAYLISIAKGPKRLADLEATRLSGLLLLIGLAGFAAWIAKAPIPHVRYLWPAIPCLWFAGIIQLTQLRLAKQREYAALAFHALILTACGSRLAADALAVANGESLTLVYQANGMSPFLLPRASFAAGRDQSSLAAFVASRPKEVRFYTLIPANGYPVTLLSGRTIAPVTTLQSTGQRFLILSPADTAVWHPGPDFVQWLRASTTPAFVSGDFAALRVREDAPLPPPSGMIRLGDDDLLRPPVTR